MQRKWPEGISTNPEAVEWLESLEGVERQRRFRPVGGSCVADDTGRTLFVGTKPDHHERRVRGHIMCLCRDSGELIVIE